MTDIIKISTANVGFSSWKKMSIGDDRQAEMAAENGNTYISGIMTDPGLSTMASSMTVSPSDCENDRQPDMAIYTVAHKMVPLLFLL